MMNGRTLGKRYRHVRLRWRSLMMAMLCEMKKIGALLRALKIVAVEPQRLPDAGYLSRRASLVSKRLADRVLSHMPPARGAKVHQHKATGGQLIPAARRGDLQTVVKVANGVHDKDPDLLRRTAKLLNLSGETEAAQRIVQILEQSAKRKP